MNKRMWMTVIGALLLTALMLSGGCSGEKEEKGVVEQASDKVAKKATDYINKPLDKAKQSQAVQNAQSQNMEDVIKESGE
ncbi:MAG: hypothetical protein D3914_10705 [Candidatus Electrothrix sp. LOE2]|nr:hypothetical protein [Candidatus Electrothrix sp. LOE2]